MKKGNNNLKVEGINYRMNLLRQSIYNKYNKRLSNYELSIFLKSAMKFTEFQMWLLDQSVKNIRLSDDDLYEKLFSLKNNDELVELYDKQVEERKNETQGHTKTRRK